MDKDIEMEEGSDGDAAMDDQSDVLEEVSMSGSEMETEKEDLSMDDLPEEEEYEFEYEDDFSDDDEENIEIENKYYESKNILDDNVSEAKQGFEEVLKMEKEKGKWGFKALKQLVKLLYTRGEYNELLYRFKQLFEYAIANAVTKHQTESVITGLLQHVAFTAKNKEQLNLLYKMYQITIEALQNYKNDRLWFNSKLGLGKLCYEIGEYSELQSIIRELEKFCKLSDGSDNPLRGTEMLEVLALQIQMYTAQKNNKKLKELYTKSLSIKSAISHPRIMGVIKECGGKMYMREKDWKKACADFFDAFKNYQESGMPRKIQSLKYLMLANMLSGTEINPFESNEVKAYANHEEIIIMRNLLNAYKQGNIKLFEDLLRENKNVMDDPFIKSYLEDLLNSVRTSVLVKILKPYTRIRIKYLAEQLRTTCEEVESLLVKLILDNEINGSIDQINGLLLLNKSENKTLRIQGLERWAKFISDVHKTVMHKFE